MNPRVFIVLLISPVAVLAAEPTSPAPLPADKAAKQMKLPEGFHASVFASEPDVVQPISFCIDDRGRLFVAEAMNYGDWKPTGHDRIIILEDTKGDRPRRQAHRLLRGFQLHHWASKSGSAACG